MIEMLNVLIKSAGLGTFEENSEDLKKFRKNSKTIKYQQKLTYIVNVISRDHMSEGCYFTITIQIWVTKVTLKNLSWVMIFIEPSKTKLVNSKIGS